MCMRTRVRSVSSDSLRRPFLVYLSLFYLRQVIYSYFIREGKGKGGGDVWYGAYTYAMHGNAMFFILLRCEGLLHLPMNSSVVVQGLLLGL